MDKDIFELASDFWINIAAGYFAALVFIGGSLSSKINSAVLLILCCCLAYYCKKQSKEQRS